MKRRWILAIAVLISGIGAISVSAKITRTTVPVRIQIDGLECRVEKAECSADEWLQSFALYQFRTTNGKGATVRMNLSECSFSNCKPVYTTVYVSRDGSWSDHGLRIEAASNKVDWDYTLNFEVEWE